MADHFFGITDIGRQRENNEDAFIVQSMARGQFILAGVIDGVGGYEGGEVAAAIAKESILQSQQHLTTDMLQSMKAVFVTANERIYKERSISDKNTDMACVATLALADLKNHKLYYAHVGDTRLYLFRDHSLIKITKDQSFVGYLEDSGRLTEDQAMKHPKRNEINHALGFDMQAILGSNYIETGESPFLPGDLILLCSDGLTDMVGTREISAILEKKILLEDKGRSLIEAANRAGGRDNITVVLVQHNRKPAKQEEKKPLKPVKKPILVKKEQVPEKVLPPREDRIPPPPRTIPPKTRLLTAVRVLSVLCLMLLTGLLWMWWKKKPAAGGVAEGTKKEHNVAEIRLQTFINASQNDTVELNGTGWGDIYLTDTIWVRRDTLVLKGRGLRLIKDSTTPVALAIMVTPQCKHLEIENITLENFPTGILSLGHHPLQLKNVQFKNCPISLAFSYPGGQPVNGRFAEGPKEPENHKLQH